MLTERCGQISGETIQPSAWVNKMITFVTWKWRNPNSAKRCFESAHVNAFRIVIAGCGILHVKQLSSASAFSKPISTSLSPRTFGRSSIATERMSISSAGQTALPGQQDRRRRLPLEDRISAAGLGRLRPPDVARAGLRRRQLRIRPGMDVLLARA